MKFIISFMITAMLYELFGCVFFTRVAKTKCTQVVTMSVSTCHLREYQYVIPPVWQLLEEKTLKNTKWTFQGL